METGRKIKVSVVIRRIDTEQDTVTNKSDDSFTTLNSLKELLNKVADKDEVDKKDLLHLINASKLSNEILADAYVDVNREDLFDAKLKSISALDKIINQINNL